MALGGVANLLSVVTKEELERAAKYASLLWTVGATVRETRHEGVR